MKKDKFERGLLSVVGMLLGILLFNLIFSSCVTKSKCDRKFPPQVITADCVRVETKEVLRDTTIFIPEDYGAEMAIFECDSLNNVLLVRLDNLVKSNGRATPGVKPSGKNSFVFDCKCDTAAIQAKVKDRVKVVTETHTETVVKTVNKIPGIGWFAIWWGIILTILVSARIIWFKFVR